MSGGAPASSHPPPPSAGAAPAPSSAPILPPLRRHLAFVSMKPPFMAPDDYHRFTSPAAPSKVADREAEAIVVRSPLKRKIRLDDNGIDSSKVASNPGQTDASSSPYHTPVSAAKGGRTNNRAKSTKSNKSVPQTPVSNPDIAGSPSALTPAGSCRYDSSLGLLTKKFVKLIREAEDGIIDLNKAAETLEAEIEKLSLEEQNLDNQIRATLILLHFCRETQERLRTLSEDDNNRRWLFVTEDDIKTLPCFLNETLIAIKAPHGTTLEVPDPAEAVDYPQRRYRIILRSTMGPIDVYLSKFEENFEEANEVGPSTSFPPHASSSSSSVNPQMEMVSTTQRTDAHHHMFSDFNASPEYVGGMMKIVPSDADVGPPISLTVHFLSILFL
ncbi:unnamed protein product [Linum tenue]|uniref:E2F/DP family winged-helix DNA-binding domain-containing protein n=1 Tax=Linum tenue TaxID=586396 RepID=A0AAV0I1F1_9ROSI|nr:unnamed protein product [Linum tenue]